MILPDYLATGLDVVFSGTAAGNKSAILGRCYADPGNRFWEVLEATGITPERLTPEQDSQVNQHGIGLTDLAKEASGVDAGLTVEMYGLAAFLERIARYAPRFVAFNGKEAARVFLEARRTRDVSIGLQSRMIGRTRIFVLPSTSGMAKMHWSEQPWRELAALIREGA